MNKLIDIICDELDDLEAKASKEGKLSISDIQYGDVLAHFKKNLLKADEMMGEGEYSNGDMYYRGGSYYGDRSYNRGRNAKRDSMGRYSSRHYSRDDGMIEQLRELMDDTPDERSRKELQRLITKMENM